MDTNNIKLFFWQNVISIHQKALLSALGKQCRTALIVEKDFSGKRLQQGWTKETIPGIEIIVSPSSQSVKNIIDNNNATNCIHIISGFSNFCFKKEDLINRMYKKGIKPFIFAEAYQNNDGIRTFVRYFLYRYYATLYRNKIAGLFAHGRTGVKCYSQCGFNNVIEWGYFTSQDDENEHMEEHTHGFRIMFVGSLTKLKNITALTCAITKVLSRIECFTIIGDGPLCSKIEKEIHSLEKIYLIKCMDNTKVKITMKQYDLLVLPSKYDGWGAVVNEALYAGCRVLASDNCGASTLLDSPERGSVFPIHDGSNTLEQYIRKEIDKGIQTPEKRKIVTQWAKTHISGEVASKEMLDFFMNPEKKQNDIAIWHKG